MLTILITHNYKKIKSMVYWKLMFYSHWEASAVEAVTDHMQELLFATEGILHSLDFTMSSAEA